jgi:general secretion pathway protein D
MMHHVGVKQMSLIGWVRSSLSLEMPWGGRPRPRGTPTSRTGRRPESPSFEVQHKPARQVGSPRQPVVRVRVLVLGLLLASLGPGADPPAWDLYEQGRAAEKAGHMAQAYLMYSQAAALDPKNQMYWLRAQAVQSRAAMEARPTLTATSPADPQADDAPPVALDEPTAQERRDARQPLPPTELAADVVRKDFDIRGDARKMFEDVAHAYGLDCIFDPDYQSVPAFRFQLRDVDYRVALRSLEASTSSFVVPMTDKLFLVARDNPQKRNDIEPYISVAVRIPEATSAQDFAILVTAVQQTFAIDRTAFDTQNNTLFLRGPISKILPARALLEDLLKPRAQVFIELRLVEVSRNDLLTYGVDFPTSLASAIWPGGALSIPNALDWLQKGAGKFLGMNLFNITLIAKMTESSGKVLLKADLRTMDGQVVNLHVGDRFPIMTAQYSTVTSSQPSSSYGLTPSFSFEDLGLTVKITPAVHSARETTLDIDAQFKVLTGQSTNGVPVVANRSVQSRSRLQFGEWSAVAGLMQSSEARAISVLAGVSRIPYLGTLTSVRDRTRSENQILLLIRPSLISLPPNETPVHTFLIGTDTKPLTPL